MKRAVIMRVLVLLTFLICVSLCFASEKEGCEDPCGKPTPWEEFNKFQIKMSVPTEPGYSFWQGQFDKETSDIQIDVETSDGTKVSKGKILMVGGRVMAVQGPITEPDYAIDALDGAVLELRLVVRLFGAALPKGPAEVQNTRSIDFANLKTGIQFATPSAQGFIPAPWRVRGEVKPIEPDVFGYHLTLTFTTREKASDKGQEQTMNFSGKLSKTANARIDDGISLDRWNVLGLGVQTRKEEAGTVSDYGAAPATAIYRTVADVRKKIAQDDYPGEPDPSKDFTGFWKEKCDEAWGVQIMHHGKEGKYSIVFCGPGGCGNPEEEGHLTFITKDPDYQVVTEDEIKERRRDDWATYHRCTKDPHPVLK